MLAVLKLDRALPNKIAKKITCNISPLTKDSNGLLGIMFNKISKNAGGSETLISPVSKFDPTVLPGWKKLAKSRDKEIAKKVVPM